MVVVLLPRARRKGRLGGRYGVGTAPSGGGGGGGAAAAAPRSPARRLARCANVLCSAVLKVASQGRRHRWHSHSAVSETAGAVVVVARQTTREQELPGDVPRLAENLHSSYPEVLAGRGGAVVEGR